MLEQAVYAGRNHALSLAAAVLALSMMAAPARAEDVARVALGESIDTFVVGADGGAWVAIQRADDVAIARIAPGAGLGGATPVTPPAGGRATLGPDGAAWFATANPGALVRADAAGAVRPLDLGIGPIDAFAAGADATLWVATAEASTLAHVTEQGVVGRTPFAPTGCEHRPQVRALAGASDGAMWATDWGCQRLLRVAGDTVQPFALHKDEVPSWIAADAAGGAWFTQDVQPVIGHVDASGAVTRLPYDSRRGEPTAIAAAPDGSAWFAAGTCALGHVSGAGIAFVPAPIPARGLGFDATGTLWLASAARVVRTSPAALDGTGCDAAPPRIRIRPATGGRIRLATLRKGFRIEVPEAARIAITAGYGRRSPRRVERTLRTRGSVTFKVPKLWLSRIATATANHQSPRLTLFVDAVDAEGNAISVGGEVRVRR
jgi:virginiamycin B lyase